MSESAVGQYSSVPSAVGQTAAPLPFHSLPGVTIVSPTTTLQRSLAPIVVPALTPVTIVVGLAAVRSLP